MFLCVMFNELTDDTILSSGVTYLPRRRMIGQMVIIDIPKSSLEMIMTTSFPEYDIKMSEATARPNVRKPYTPGNGESGSDEQLSGELVLNQSFCFRGELTGQSVDEQTEKHGDHSNKNPTGEFLVLHAAVDCYRGFMALQTHTNTHFFCFSCAC